MPPLHRRYAVLAAVVLTTPQFAGVVSPPSRQIAQEIGRTDSLAIDDGMLHYRVAGRGQPVVLLSGGPGLSGDYLQAVYRHLANTSRAVLLDQRGTGLSRLARMDSTTLTVRKAVDDIEALRVRLGVDRLFLLGHSWGGALALAYTAVHPRQVAGIVLIGSAAPSFTKDLGIGEKLKQRLTSADLDSIRQWSNLAAVPARNAEAMLQLGRLNRKAYLFDGAMSDAVERTRPPESFNWTVGRLMTQDLQRTRFDVSSALADAARSTEPPLRALVVYGEADVIGEATAPQIRAALPNAPVRVVRHSGHYPWVEAPEDFYAIIDAVLSEWRRQDASPH
jgi:proline iminopeptidase